MIKNILVLYFFCAFFTGIAMCEENIEIDSQVINVNPDNEYIIIKAGEDEGVEIGDGLIVHRDGEKLAEAQIVEVRANIAAAEILTIEKEIKEGDEVLIVKKTEEEWPVHKETKKSKWTTLMGSGAQPGSTTSIESAGPGYLTRQEGSAVKADIGTDSNAVFSYAMIILREKGYSVILSDRITGTILATTPIELSLIKELWADAAAAIEHKLVISLEIKDNDGAAELSVTGFREHIQKGKQIKVPIIKESKYYSSNLMELASKIKERAER